MLDGQKYDGGKKQAEDDQPGDEIAQSQDGVLEEGAAQGDTQNQAWFAIDVVDGGVSGQAVAAFRNDMQAALTAVANAAVVMVRALCFVCQAERYGQSGDWAKGVNVGVVKGAPDYQRPKWRCLDAIGQDRLDGKEHNVPVG